MESPFHPLPAKAYRVILADPPWRFRTWTQDGGEKSAAKHYSLMSMADLKALPVADLAEPDCMLFMWAVQAMIPEAVELMAAWGFKFKTMGAWAKRSPSNASWAFGTGYVLRNAAEFYMIGTRGAPDVVAKDVRNLIVAPTREHSRKPEALKYCIEQLHPFGRRVELFSRESRKGWDAWGNEAAKFKYG